GNARSYFGETSILTSDYDVQQITRKGGLLVLCEEDGCRPDFRNWMQTRFGIDVKSLVFTRSVQPYYYVPKKLHTMYWAKIDYPATSK
ncbi:MAG TPA: hypothetical protein VFF53_02565, partial [Geobacteraceae bacterium]|nr:hypothetical protein [Geobacteraceae bacterium]